MAPGGGAELLRSGAVRPDVQPPRGCGQGRPCARRRLLTFAYKPGPRTRCAQEAHCEGVKRELHGGEYANEAHGQVNEEVGQKKWESPDEQGKEQPSGKRTSLPRDERCQDGVRGEKESQEHVIA